MLPEKFCVIFLWMSLAFAYVSSGKLRRQQRDLLDLADMFDTLTGLDPTDYIPYGNWCGYGGQGKPVDHIDSCCQIHDECYGQSEKKCSNVQVHVVQYAWKINNATIICSDEANCEASICKCDKEVVECIAQHSHTYSEYYRFIRKSR
ncbi:basic phospholipase A2 caudoxin-like [Stegodyphus dumicola]|uniref:basic phospholipase A2 caudoxin-like n=1 Tax=Stegodyphus dumicola TaxID=202533 RepID=UPI0015B108AC|nr:basic phospholipase A2 caudoxin-like [Stegodyphus dumicola]